MCAWESFLGVIYAGLVGSVFFGKMLRIQSRAQVLFSHPIVLQYGSRSVLTTQHDKNEKEGKIFSGLVEKVETSVIACPILEFRIVNRLHDEIGGEIMDATIQAVASPDGTIVEFGGKTTTERLKELMNSGNQMDDESAKAPGGSRRPSLIVTSVLNSQSDIPDQRTEKNISIAEIKRGTETREEQNPDHIAPSNHNFSELLLEASEHPFFRRVWVIQHILNDTSPLLTSKVRKLIRKNHGYWPEKLNNASDVRNSLKFNQILVSLCGISNISGDGVSAQKVYDLVDVVVGYQFIEIINRSSDGTLKVDLTLLNDVKEQCGGGGEYLGV